MYNTITQINHLFNAAIDNAAPQQSTLPNPTEPTAEDKDFWQWFAKL